MEFQLLFLSIHNNLKLIKTKEMKSLLKKKGFLDYCLAIFGTPLQHQATRQTRTRTELLFTAALFKDARHTTAAAVREDYAG